MLRRLSRPEHPPIDVPSARSRLRMDATDEDVDLDRLIRTSAEVLEKHTGLVMGPTSFEYRADAWPACMEIKLPAAPVRDVSAVVYLDEDEAEQTLPASDWSWERTHEGATITLATGFSNPTVLERAGAIRVRFTAGFDDPSESGAGDDPDLVLPATAEMAMLFLVGHWNEHRESVAEGAMNHVPETFDLLASQLRIYR